MKIFCIDSDAASRLALKRKLEEAYEANRQSCGHLPLPELIPASVSELTFLGAPNLVVAGCSLGVEQTLHSCAALKKALSPGVPLIAFVKDSECTLRNLRRFEPFTTDVLSESEPPARIVHAIARLAAAGSSGAGCRLVTVSAVKGGVGSTSLAGALAHAAAAAGHSSIVIDLSAQSCLCHYLHTERWQSPELASAFTDNRAIDGTVLDRAITAAPNGVTLLLPPAGGSTVRELWLRDPSRLELMLEIVDMLRARYDLILIDLGHAEGIAPYALEAWADVRVLVSSTDPASAHLLSRRYSALTESPGAGACRVAVMETNRSGLSPRDVCRIALGRDIDPTVILPAVPYDARGAGWMGTGNTFYTEACSTTQDRLDRVLCRLMGKTEPARKRRLFVLPEPRRALAAPARPLLPFLRRTNREEAPSSPVASRTVTIAPAAAEPLRPARLALPGPAAQRQLPASAYAPPRPMQPEAARERSAERGSLGLEHAMFITASALLAATMWPAFSASVKAYVGGFSEPPATLSIDPAPVEDGNAVD